MDKKILKTLYEQYSRELYLYLYMLCREPSLAEDLLQETFLKAILSLPQGHRNMRAWLYMVGRNLFLNHRKKAGREIPMEENTPPPQEHDLLSRLLRDEENLLLYQALKHLEPRKREILLLQYFSGLSQKEIAAAMGLTPENVRILAHRGKLELKRYMEEHHYDLS